MKRKVLMALLFLLFSSPVFAAGIQENPWVLKKDQEGIKVYTRQVEGSPIREFRAEIVLEAPLEKVTGLFEQENQMLKWFHRCAEAKRVEEISQTEKRVYFAVDVIWPFSDRDGVYRSVKTTDPAAGAVFYTMFADNQNYPLRKHRVRIHRLDTQWRFMPLAGGHTRMEYQQHSETGGFVPPEFVNLFVVSLPFKTLKKFRVLLEEHV